MVPWTQHPFDGHIVRANICGMLALDDMPVRRRIFSENVAREIAQESLFVCDNR
jgi:hypothetical protein